MLWLKTFHITFMVSWMAALLYLPRLFVYHAMTDSQDTAATFVVMERKLMIMAHLAATLTWVFGVWLLWQTPAWLVQGWMQLKLALIISLLLYHHVCMRLMATFARGENQRSHKWYRWFNEVPIVILLAVVALVEIKPF